MQAQTRAPRVTVDRPRILAFRAAGHHLGVRLGPDGLATAVGAAGVRDVKGSGILSLHARLESVTRGHLQAAITGGQLVDVMSARGTRTLVPTDVVAAFTVGTLPAEEESLQARLKPLASVLEKSGQSATEALRRVRLYVLMGVSADPAQARTELVRRYLRCYGPSTPAHFAEWCGISVGEARRSLETAGGTEVEGRRFLLPDDLGSFDSPPRATGVRILPPRDPYLLDRDRATLVPDREAQKRVWRANPTDGLILADGLPIASWRTKKTGKRLQLNVEPFTKLSKRALNELGGEAQSLAAHRDCTSCEVSM